MLWDGITAVLGPCFHDIAGVIEVLKTSADHGGPLKVDISHNGDFPKIYLQYYRRKGMAYRWSCLSSAA